MAHTVFIPVAAVAALTALVFVLPKKTKPLTRITMISFFVVFFSGFSLYFYANLQQQSGIVAYASAVLASLYEAGAMFFFNHAYSVFEVAFVGQPAFDLWAVFFWLIHFCAALVTVTTTLSLLGRKLLTRMTLALNFTQPVFLLCGITQQSITFGKDLADKKGRRIVVYLDDAATPAQLEEIAGMGAIYLDAPPTDIPALRHAGLRRRIPLSLFAMTDDAVANYRILITVLGECMQLPRCAQGLRLLIRTNSGEIRDALDREMKPLIEKASAAKRSVEQGGRPAGKAEKAAAIPLPDVRLFNEAELGIRLLFRKCPPYAQIPFGPDARATGDFTMLIVGFGVVGQAALREAYMQCQFIGCNFRAMVVDRELAHAAFLEYYPIFAGSSVKFIKADAFSQEFLELLDSNGDIRYAVVSLGSDQRNIDAAFMIRNRMERMPGRACPPVAPYIRNHENVQYLLRDDLERQGVYPFGQYNGIFTHDVLVDESLDTMARAVHAHYEQLYPGTAPWERLSVFTKESNRAAAMRIDAKLFALGLTRQRPDVEPVAAVPLQELESLLQQEGIRETLMQTEHMGWAAFHFANGWQTWRPAEQPSQKPVNKDEAKKLHIALVEWEELPQVERDFNLRVEGYNATVVDQRETAKRVEWMESDRVSVLSMPAIVGNCAGQEVVWRVAQRCEGINSASAAPQPDPGMIAANRRA